VPALSVIATIFGPFVPKPSSPTTTSAVEQIIKRKEKKTYAAENIYTNRNENENIENSRVK
jgi:hypothetical protein